LNHENQDSDDLGIRWLSEALDPAVQPQDDNECVWHSLPIIPKFHYSTGLNVQDSNLVIFFVSLCLRGLI